MKFDSNALQTSITLRKQNKTWDEIAGELVKQGYTQPNSKTPYLGGNICALVLRASPDLRKQHSSKKRHKRTNLNTRVITSPHAKQKTHSPDEMVELIQLATASNAKNKAELITAIVKSFLT